MAKHVLADSGYWIALFDERDKYHIEAQLLADEISSHTLLVPWPTLYEFVNTRLSRRKQNLIAFRRFLEAPNTKLLDDSTYRTASLNSLLDGTGRAYSLVDQVVRSMLSDEEILVHGFISFNTADFYDICYSRGIELLYS